MRGGVRHVRSRSIETDSIGWAAFPELFASAVEYTTDFVHRQILFWDTLRQRGNQYREHSAKLAPHVLNYAFEARACTSASRGACVTTLLATD